MDTREVRILNIDDVLPNRFQPRIQFDEKAINELAKSIKVHGVIQPIVVRKISDKFEIIAGERRYKASVLAGKTTIPAIITSLDDRESAEIALIENVQRQNLTPIEEAISYKKILDMGYLNQITLGEKLGKTQSTIANKLRLLNLNEEVQEALMENKISERHARSLLRLDDQKQVVMLKRIIAERLTVRKTDEEIEKMITSSDDNNDDQNLKEMSEIMDNDVFKDLDIPTEPIIEDIDSISKPILETIDFDIPEPLQSTSNISEDNQIEENLIDVNPGFMNVDKIEQEAKDIYVPTETADIDLLMDTSHNPKIEESLSPMQDAVVPKIVENTPDTVPGGGKFFTMFSREEDTNPDFVKDIESKEVNMNFEQPKVAETFNFGQATIDPEPVVEETVNPNPLFSMEEPVKNDIDLDKTMDFTQTFKPFSLNDDNAFTNNQNDSQFEMQQPLEESITPITDNFEQPKEITPSYTMPEPITYDEMGEIKVKLPDQQKLATTDLKTVINTIRECVATIERFGFTIDTEEIDFEDRYQVTFTIDKN